MKAFLVVLLFILAFPLLSQYSEIELGKRYHPLYSREIRAENLGHRNTSYRRLFYKRQNAEDFQYAGLFGGKLKPHLDLSIPEVKASFQRYQRKKRWSYVLGGGAFVCLEAWALSSFDEMIKSGNVSYKAYFSKRSLPWLVVYFLSSYPSMYVNFKADYDLLDAVNLHNKIHGISQDTP